MKEKLLKKYDLEPEQEGPIPNWVINILIVICVFIGPVGWAAIAGILWFNKSVVCGLCGELSYSLEHKKKYIHTICLNPACKEGKKSYKYFKDIDKIGFVKANKKYKIKWD